MGFFSEDKPETAVTSMINAILSEKQTTEFTPEVQLPALLECIKMQNQQGAVEAARAIRKKLKYGSPVVQLNTLVLLELLVSNGGRALAPLYSDTRLIDRLRSMISDSTVNTRVRKRLVGLTGGWSASATFINDPMYKDLLALYKVTKKYYRPIRRSYSAVPEFMNDSADELSDSEYSRVSRSPPRGHTDMDQVYSIPKVDLRKAGPEIDKLLAEAANGCKLLRKELAALPEGKSATRSVKCNIEFDKCRQIRRKVLRYLQIVTEGEYLGQLIAVNDELVDVLQKFTDKSKRPNSSGFISESSEDEEAEEESVAPSTVDEFESSEDESVNNPFSDKNKVRN